MPDVEAEAQWQAFLEQLRHLPPLRNITAIRAWLVVFKSDRTAAVFDRLAADAAKGSPAPKNIMLMVMAAFAAGRAYQQANPDAPRDPDGYGG